MSVCVCANVCVCKFQLEPWKKSNVVSFILKKTMSTLGTFFLNNSPNILGGQGYHGTRSQVPRAMEGERDYCKSGGARESSKEEVRFDQSWEGQEGDLCSVGKVRSGRGESWSQAKGRASGLCG